MNHSKVNTDDPYLWLEEVESERALAWARQHNDSTKAELGNHPDYVSLFQNNLEVYDSKEQIAYPVIRGKYLYNFWQDADHQRGVWRRTGLQDYCDGDPQWEVLIDLDELAEAENENWVWAGSDFLFPDETQCMVSLSRGGADAAVKREFDVSLRRFKEDGFTLPEAKGLTTYLDPDTLLVSTDFGPGSLTHSGYPRITKKWHRGTPLSEAETLFEGNPEDIGVYSMLLHTRRRDYLIVYRYPSFFTISYYLMKDNTLHHIPIPDDARIETIFANQLLISLKSDWKTGGRTWPAGSLISVDIEALFEADCSALPVFIPDRHSAVSSVTRTSDLVLIDVMKDVRSRLLTVQFKGGQWQAERLDTPQNGQIDIITSRHDASEYFFTYTDFLTPTSLYMANGSQAPQLIRSLPEYFDATDFVTHQYFADSADGTRVPYFVVAHKDINLDGSNPTLIYAYGGFEVSITPAYLPTVGLSWLQKGGVYVVANIRGGGEYGPQWHRCAQRRNRQRSYDDCYAVAEALIERKITSPKHLGIKGGSGGGLLVGMLFTQRPELFNAVVCQVPLLDMKRYNKLLAGASWMEEYGDPDDPQDWQWLQKYSPYHQLDKNKQYPRVFFTTSTRDDRVHPAHARKMVAKMTAMGIPNLYYENIEGGHGGAANNRQSATVNALVFSFLLNELGNG